MLAGLTPLAPAQIVLGQGALPADLEEPTHEGALRGRAVEECPRLVSGLRGLATPRVVEKQAQEGVGLGGPADPGLPRDAHRLPIVLARAVEILQLAMKPAQLALEAREPERIAVAPRESDSFLEVLPSLADPTQVDLGVAREHEGHEGGRGVARLGGEGEGFREARLGLGVLGPPVVQGPPLEEGAHEHRPQAEERASSTSGVAARTRRSRDRPRPASSSVTWSRAAARCAREPARAAACSASWARTAISSGRRAKKSALERPVRASHSRSGVARGPRPLAHQRVVPDGEVEAALGVMGRAASRAGAGCSGCARARPRARAGPPRGRSGRWPRRRRDGRSLLRGADAVVDGGREVAPRSKWRARAAADGAAPSPRLLSRARAARRWSSWRRAGTRSS